MAASDPITIGLIADETFRCRSSGSPSERGSDRECHEFRLSLGDGWHAAES
jgi:hypothetical protein